MRRLFLERSVFSNICLILIVASLGLVIVNFQKTEVIVSAEGSHKLSPGRVGIKESIDREAINTIPEVKRIQSEMSQGGDLRARVNSIQTLKEKQEAIEAEKLAYEALRNMTEDRAVELQAEIREYTLAAVEELNKTASEIYKNMADLDLQVGSKVPKDGTQLAEYSDMINLIVTMHNEGKQYKLNSSLVKAVIMQESGGDTNADNGAAKGLMQIEYTVVPSFIKYGKERYGETWTEADRLDPYKCVDYGVYALAGYVNYYQGDYIKALQAYNYSHYSLDKLISVYGDEWMDNRGEMARLNNKAKYGDSLYVEHVLAHYEQP